MRALTASGKGADALQVMAQLQLQAAGSAPPAVYHEAFAACRQLRSGDRALALLRGMEAKDLKSYSLAMLCCVKARQWPRVMELFREMEGIWGAPTNGGLNWRDRPHFEKACQYAIHACEKLEHWQTSRLIYDKGAELGVRFPHYTAAAVMRTAAKARQWAYAETLVDAALRDVKAAGIINVNIALKVLGHARQPERTRRLFDKLPDLGLAPDQYTYTALMHAYALAGQHAAALELIQGMREAPAGGRPMLTITVFNSAISACEKAHRPADALRLLDLALESGLQPDVITYSTLMVACAKAGNATRTLELFGEVLRRDIHPKFDHVTMDLILCNFAKGGHAEEALELLRLMKLNGMPIVDVAYNAVIAACCRAERHQALLEVYEEMRSAGLQPDEIGYSMVLKAYEHVDRGWEGAAEMVRDLDRADGADVAIYARVMALAARHGEIWTVAGLYDNLRKSRTKEPSMECCNALVTAQYKAGHDGAVNGAVDVLQHLEAADRPVGVEAYASAISSCRATDDWKTAVSLFNQFCRRAKEGALEPNAILYNTILNVLGADTDRQREREFSRVLKDMWRREVVPDLGTYTSRMAFATRGKRWRSVLAIWRELDAIACSQSATSFALGIRAAEMTGDGAQAKAMLQQMVAAGIAPDAPIFKAAIAACGRGTSADVDSALELLESMEAHGVVPTQECFGAAIGACDRGRKWRKAIHLLLLMIQEGHRPDITTYNAAISSCARAGEWTTALKLLANIQNSGLEPNDFTYATSIAASFRGGHGSLALDQLHEMVGAGFKPSATTASLVVEALFNAGEVDSAVGTFEHFLVESTPRTPEGAVDLRRCSSAVAAAAIRSQLRARSASSSGGGDLVFTISTRHAHAKPSPVSRPSLHELLRGEGPGGFQPPLRVEVGAGGNKPVRLVVGDADAACWCNAQGTGGRGGAV